MKLKEYCQVEFITADNLQCFLKNYGGYIFRTIKSAYLSDNFTEVGDLIILENAVDLNNIGFFDMLINKTIINRKHLVCHEVYDGQS